MPKAEQEDMNESRSTDKHEETDRGSITTSSELFREELRRETPLEQRPGAFEIMVPRPKLIPTDREITGGLPLFLDGKFETNTGDKLEFSRFGLQTLQTNGGGKLELDSEGNITGDGIKSIRAGKDGKERIVTMDDGTTVVLDKSGIARVEHPLPQDKPGSYTLTNGDKLESDGKSQTLTTKDGARIKVNPDGSYEVDGKLVAASGDGKTIKLANGTTVHLGNGKIAGVERDGKNANVAGEIPREKWDPTVAVARELELPPIYTPNVPWLRDFKPVVRVPELVEIKPNPGPNETSAPLVGKPELEIYTDVSRNGKK